MLEINALYLEYCFFVDIFRIVIIMEIFTFAFYSTLIPSIIKK